MPEITLPSSTRTQKGRSSAKKKANNNKNAPNKRNDPQVKMNEDKTSRHNKPQDHSNNNNSDDTRSDPSNRFDDHDDYNGDDTRSDGLNSQIKNTPSDKKKSVNNGRFSSHTDMPSSKPRNLRRRRNNDPWADPWGDDPWDMDDAPTRSAPSKRTKMTPQERVAMIEEVYQHVLGRKPDTRDINYYKYSTLSDDEIKSQLLEGKEHSQLLEDGREYKKMKERAEQAEVRVKSLEGQIKDQLEEFKQLTNLLKEKNNLIQQLRAKLNNPYGFSQSSNQRIDEYTRQNREHYSVAVEEKKETPKDDSEPIYSQKLPQLEEEGTIGNGDVSPVGDGIVTEQFGSHTEEPNDSNDQTADQFERDNHNDFRSTTNDNDQVASGNRSFSYDQNLNNEDPNTFTNRAGNIEHFNAAEPPTDSQPVQTSVEVDSPQIQSVDDALDTFKEVSEETAQTAQKAMSKLKSDVANEYNQVEQKFKERKIIPPGGSEEAVPPTTVGAPHSVENEQVRQDSSAQSDIGSVIFSSSLPPKEETTNKDESTSGIKDRIRKTLSL